MLNLFLDNAIDYFLEKYKSDARLFAKIIQTKLQVFYKRPLEEPEKELMALILFSYAMRLGPSSWIEAIIAAREIDVEDLYIENAKDWVSYSKIKRQ